MIPGKAGTPWEKGLYPLELQFSESYPAKPPDCRFPKGFFHPNGENVLNLKQHDSAANSLNTNKAIVM